MSEKEIDRKKEKNRRGEDASAFSTCMTENSAVMFGMLMIGSLLARSRSSGEPGAAPGPNELELVLGEFCGLLVCRSINLTRPTDSCSCLWQSKWTV